jgi:hypothetical protein
LGLNTRGPIDPRWPYHNRGIVYGLQLAQIEIYTALGTSETYNATTNAWTATTNTLWKGKARIQPKGSGNSTNAINSSFDPTTSESILVQISFGRNKVTGNTNVPDLRPNDRMRVISSPVDGQLTKFLYVITNVLNSSNPWECSFMCRVDVEIDPTVI